MEFTNNGEPVKIRVGEPSNCYWSTIGKGESVELPLEYGLRLGFIPKTTEGKIGDQVVETKQINTVKVTDDFLKELQSINGIGKKTAKDIVNWGTKEKLIEVIAVGGHLPFRDDVVEKLRRYYG